MHHPVRGDSRDLDKPGATFVTLHLKGKLRGCVGSLEAHRALRLDVSENALGAAFRDPRFKPLMVEELEFIEVEVSLLSPLEPLLFTSQQEALSLLSPGNFGVVLQFERHRSTFLPQVWDQLPEPERFLQHLKQKAGLPTDFWHPELKLFRYGVSKWKETDFSRNEPIST